MYYYAQFMTIYIKTFLCDDSPRVFDDANIELSVTY